MSCRRLIAAIVLLNSLLPAEEGSPVRDKRCMVGWTVNISSALIQQDAAGVEKAMQLLRLQLEEIVRVVPKAAVAELQKVTLWVSPEYAGFRPRAEYHPGAGWLKENGRDPVMAKGVEFTNVRIFEEETRRMPNFTLHELAHAYHDRVLGNDQKDILAAYEKAKSSKSYDKVEHWHGKGPTTFDRAYAMNNPMEYFAESTEAFFSRNDFYPFTREELAKHDPGMLAVLQRVWGAP